MEIEKALGIFLLLIQSMAGSKVAAKMMDKKNNASTSLTKYKNQKPNKIAMVLKITLVEMSICLLFIFH